MTRRWRKLGRALVILVLLAALVLLLLRFQGILWRTEHALDEVALPPRLEVDARLATVEEREVPLTETYPGFVEAIDPADVASRVMARVLTVTHREGESVASGSVLATLDDADAVARLSAAQAASTAARAMAMRGDLEFARAQRLLEAKAMTQRDWEAARAARNASAAQVQQAEKEVEGARTALRWYQLRAPFAGRVLERLVEPGSLAVPGHPMLRLYRQSKLRFRVAVPEHRAAGLEKGRALRVETARGMRDATLTRALPATDPGTGTVILHLSPEGADDLRPGAFCRLSLPVGTRRVLLLPHEAVRRIGQIEQVHVVHDDRVVPAAVKTGRRHGASIEILSGLSAGERVVLP